MSDIIDRMTKLIRTRMIGSYPQLPKAKILHQLLDVAYLATLKTEEGRFIRGSLTIADPLNPEPDPPITRRADYPAFTPLENRIKLTVDSLVKLSRAIDKWSGSIAVFGNSRSGIYAWGVLDQMLHHNVYLNREGTSGSAYPGMLTFSMEGPGEIAIYHCSLFVARMLQDRIITKEYDALLSKAVTKKSYSNCIVIAKKIRRVTGTDSTTTAIVEQINEASADTIARLCIGLRRLGTGGAFLITPKPVMKYLTLHYSFQYDRLRDGVILGIVDRLYYNVAERKILFTRKENVSTQLVRRQQLADAQLEDRELETSGAVRVVTSLAAVDGIVLLTPNLEVKGFGVKISSGLNIGKVYDGQSFIKKGASALQIDMSQFGTRHSSMLRYCRIDPNAIGVIVSQDGHVRLATTVGRSLVLWQQVRLLDYSVGCKSYFKSERRSRRFRDQIRHETSRGYTPMPKTFKELMKH